MTETQRIILSLSESECLLWRAMFGFWPIGKSDLRERAMLQKMTHESFPHGVKSVEKSPAKKERAAA